MLVKDLILLKPSKEQSFKIGTFNAYFDMDFWVHAPVTESAKKRNDHNIAGKFGSLAVYLCDRQIKIHQYFILSYKLYTYGDALLNCQI